MSITYMIDGYVNDIKADIEGGLLRGLTIKHKPLDMEGKPSLWPYAFVDIDGNHGWLEEPNMILFWGQSDPTKIMTIIKNHGYPVIGIF